MATAERINVSLPSDLAELMRSAGLSPSVVLQDALRERLGVSGQLPLSARVDQLSEQVAGLSRELARLKRQVGKSRQ